jgi:hypothetical protein
MRVAWERSESQRHKTTQNFSEIISFRFAKRTRLTSLNITTISDAGNFMQQPRRLLNVAHNKRIYFNENYSGSYKIIFISEYEEMHIKAGLASYYLLYS